MNKGSISIKIGMSASEVRGYLLKVYTHDGKRIRWDYLYKLLGVSNRMPRKAKKKAKKLLIRTIKNIR